MSEFLLGFLFLFPLFMVAVVIHEVSHGWVALQLGDSTAKEAGRLTLNPLKHIDPVGTVILPLFLVLIRAPFVFGWARPVPINILNLRHPKQDMLWVGIAGPLANFLLAIVASLFLKFWGGDLSALLGSSLRALITINLVLGTFNLLPVPPLDGSRVLTSLLPISLARGMILLERWGILLIFFLLAFGWVDRFLWPMVGWFYKLLGI